MLEISQIAQNLQDHVQMQNLHQSYDQKIQSSTLTVIGKSRIWKTDMTGTKNQKEQPQSQKQFYEAQRHWYHNSARYPPKPDISVPLPHSFTTHLIRMLPVQQHSA